MDDMSVIHSSKIHKAEIVTNNESAIDNEIKQIIQNRKITKSLYDQMLFDQGKTVTLLKLKKLNRIDNFFDKVTEELLKHFEEGSANASAIYQKLVEEQIISLSPIRDLQDKLKKTQDKVDEVDKTANKVLIDIQKSISEAITLGECSDYQDLLNILGKGTDQNVVAFRKDFLYQMNLLETQINKGGDILKIAIKEGSSDEIINELIKKWIVAIRVSLSQNLISTIIAEYSLLMGYDEVNKIFKDFGEKLKHTGSEQVVTYKGSDIKFDKITRKSDDQAEFTIKRDGKNHTLTLGLTSKFYLSKGQSFKEFVEKETFKTKSGTAIKKRIAGAPEVSSGSAGSLLSIIRKASRDARLPMINYWSNAYFQQSDESEALDKKLKNLNYNYSNDMTDLSIAIKQHRLLILLSFLSAFSSAGVSDTSLLFSINGVLLSIPEIIKKILENDSVTNLSYFFGTTLHNNYYSDGYLLNIEKEFWGNTPEEGYSQRLKNLDKIKVVFHMRFYRIAAFLNRGNLTF